MISSNDRIHTSKLPIKRISVLTARQEHTFKPTGFWYGFGDSWIQWVRSEMPEWEGKYTYKIYINTSNILRITNATDMKKFHDKYSKSDAERNPIRRSGSRPKPKIPDSWAFPKMIYWQNVAYDYAGIEITPYLSEFRMKDGYMWYYGWDVASGCIWRSDAITNYEEVKK